MGLTLYIEESGKEVQKLSNMPIENFVKHPRSYAPKLNLRQRRFCQEYVNNGGVGTKAAESAGYSKRTSSVCASNLLDLPKVQDEISRLEGERRAASNWNRQNYLERVAELMRSTKTDSVKCRCLEIIGKAEGFLDADNKTNVNIGLFDVVKDFPPLPTKFVQGNIANQAMTVTSNNIDTGKIEVPLPSVS